MSSEHPILDEFFPGEEIAQAVDACRKQDRRLDMYYKFAPPSAKPFIELGFYSTHFGDRVDQELYSQCRDAIAPTLTEDDIRYLLRFETDVTTRDILKELLRNLKKPKLYLRRKASESASSAPSVPQPPQTPVPPPPPVTTANPPPRIPRRPQRIRIGVDADLLKLLALLVAVGGILFFVVDSLDLGGSKSESRKPKVKNLTTVRTAPVPDVSPLQTQEVARAQQPAVKAALPTKTATTFTAITPAEPLAADTTASNVVRKSSTAQVKTRTRKLVLTDGTSIRTRPDGTIEVPRAFSYAGARLKKPFWIYDRQLEKSGRIEYEARAEKAARDKWKAFYDEAVRSMSCVTNPPQP